MQLIQTALKVDRRTGWLTEFQLLHFIRQYGQAIENVRQLILADPDYEHYQTGLSALLSLLGEYSEASEWIVKTEGMTAQETSTVIQLIVNVNREDLLPRLIDQLSDDNPIYDQILKA